MGAWSDWFARDDAIRFGGTPVVVKMANPNNWSISEISDISQDDARRKGKKNAKQITWVLLLRAHRAAGCLASLASGSMGLISAARRRVSAGRADSSRHHRLYTFIKFSLFLSITLLCFELYAYFKQYHLTIPDYTMAIPSIKFNVNDFFGSFYTGWTRIRAEYIAPPLQFLSDACVVLFLIQSADRLILCLGCFWIKLRGVKPVPKGAFGSKEGSDLEAGEHFPMVLVQIPMCNEREVRIMCFKVEICLL
jgi:hypothetical protein